MTAALQEQKPSAPSLNLTAGACLTADLERSLREYQKARKGDQPIINAHKGGLEAKAHIEPQAHRHQSKKWQRDGGDNDTRGSVLHECGLLSNL